MHAQNSPTAEKEETYDAQLIGDDFLLSLASCDSGKKLFMSNWLFAKIYFPIKIFK